MAVDPIDLATLPRFAEHVQPPSSGASAAARTPPPPAYAVRDVWRRADAPDLAPVGGVFRPPQVPPRDSAFYVVSPTI